MPPSFVGQRLALAGGGEDRDLVAVLREAPRRRRAHAAAARRDDRHLQFRHGRVSCASNATSPRTLPYQEI